MGSNVDFRSLERRCRGEGIERRDNGGPVTEKDVWDFERCSESPCIGTVVDLFCGAGGLTCGLKREGLCVVAGVDMDGQYRYAYERNNASRFVERDIERFSASELSDLFGTNEARVLVGCAPCQPFSVYNQKNNNRKWQLVQRFAELIVQTQPDVVSMENVPRLFRYREGIVFEQFVHMLEDVGYHVAYEVVFLPDYGLPQYRRRLVLMASLHGKIWLESPSVGRDDYQTVEEALGHLPPIAAGEADPGDRLHTASRLSPLNLKRIRASMPGGSWADWEEELRAECHRSDTGKGYKSVYGRMKLEEPAPTITTQFYGFGNGRFGHPEQDRAISLREGAILQGFPLDYDFVPANEKIQFKSVGRMIGNAVPVVLARAIGRAIAEHLTLHGISRRGTCGSADRGDMVQSER